MDSTIVIQDFLSRCKAIEEIDKIDDEVHACRRCDPDANERMHKNLKEHCNRRNRQHYYEWKEPGKTLYDIIEETANNGY